MKLFFLRSDSLYTIFTTIEKIEHKKNIEIFIENGNQFFLNEWWWKQIKELLHEKNMTATFVVGSKKKEEFLKSLWLKTRRKKQAKRKKALKLLYSFFFNVKHFHAYFYHKKHYFLYLIFWIEVIVILLIFYFLYTLILPSTTIKLFPFYHSEPIVYNFRYIPEDYNSSGSLVPLDSITIPYFTGSISYNEKVTITNNDLQYLSAPAQGTIRLVNKTEKAISLVPDTQIISENWLIFKIKEQVTIPAKVGNSAGYINTIARARTYDINGKIIGERGNVKKGELFYIKNLAQSLYKKEVYAEVVKDFQKIEEKNFVSWKDRAILLKKLSESIEQKKMKIINESVDQKKKIYLPFEKTVSIQNPEYSFSKTRQTTGHLVNGTMDVEIIYTYITPQDLQTAVEQYLEERKSETTEIIKINISNTSFLTLKTGDYQTYNIPTKVNIIGAYDFVTDKNWIKNEVKNIALSNKNIESIKKWIISFQEIANVSITHKPFWSNNIANTRSRIFIDVDE